MVEKLLRGKVVLLPESRELDLMAAMVEQRGGQAVRCPLVAILDAPDPRPVRAWVERCAAGAFDDVIFFTGEGVSRLAAQARAVHALDRYIRGLYRTRKITRGPKPVRALRELGLTSDLPAPVATTDGVIEALTPLDLTGRRVGLQLYGSEPNEKLVGFLESKGARVDPVAPYRYADAFETQQVVEAMDRVVAGGVDAIAFTSATQVRRWHAVASRRGRWEPLREAMGRCVVAAVGPLVAEQLDALGTPADVMPERTYFLKPMVNRLAEALARDAAR